MEDRLGSIVRDMSLDRTMVSLLVHTPGLFEAEAERLASLRLSQVDLAEIPEEN